MKRNRFFVLVLGAGMLSACEKKAETPLPPTPAASANATNAAAVAAAPKAQFDKLPGKWLRPDGGYILEIRSVDTDGKMDVGYFNPSPINVAKAVASLDGTATRVFVELRDVNYPGSTYTLAYDSAHDQLAGVYYQAALQERFEVFFERTR